MRILQLIDAVLARSGLLHAFPGLPQTLLPLSGHEEQRGQETDDEKRRHGDVPSSQAIQGIAQEIHAIHFVNNSKCNARAKYCGIIARPARAAGREKLSFCTASCAPNVRITDVGRDFTSHTLSHAHCSARQSLAQFRFETAAG